MDIVTVRDLRYAYDGAGGAVLNGVSLSLARGARCLLMGRNGSGKSTLMRILSGRYVLDPPSAVVVDNKRPFFDTHPGIRYVSSEVSPHHRGDVSVAVLLKSSGADEHPQRCEQILDAFSIDRTWRMHRLSDGQRRRVICAMALMRPLTLLLLDEATTDMDVIVRRRFLNFLKWDCETNGLTVIYCTHIFDGLGGWATQIVHIAQGEIIHSDKLHPAHIPDLHQIIEVQKQKLAVDGEGAWECADSVLYALVEKWLWEDEQIPEEAEGVRRPPRALAALAEESDKYYDYWERR